MKYLSRKTMKATTHSQAQCQVAPANAKTKTCHRACLFATAYFADTEKTKSFKTEKTK